MLWQFDWSTIRPDNVSPIRRQRNLTGLAFSILMSLIILGFASPAMANCQTLLGDDTYRCRVKADDGENFPDCFTFVTPGVQSDDFDLFSESLGDTLGCDCKATGTFAAPNFSQANSFHCVTPPEAGLGLAFDSKVNNRGRVLLGEAIIDTGTSFKFRCVRVSSCQLPAVPQGADKRSW